MRHHLSLAAFVLACASAAQAQDSVSKLNGLPGDAVDAHSPADQINDYVVDLAAIRSSWGTAFGIAPIVKTSQQRNAAPLFFNGIANAQAISKTIATNQPFLRASYDLWTAPGFGVNNNSAKNDAGAPLSAAGLTGARFGFATAEFMDGDPTGTSLANIVGGVAHMTNARPSRLYVSRVVAASNSPTDSCNLAAFGMGAIDDAGNVHFRADNFSTLPCGTLNPVTGNNYFRVSLPARSASVNFLSSVGASDPAATTHLLAGSTTTHNTPNIVPASIAGRPILIGTNFSRQYVFEQVAGGVVAGTANAHFAAGISDHRGALGYTPANFPTLFAGAVNGTAGILARTAAASTLCGAINVVGVDANGGFVAPRALTLPALVSDPDSPNWNSQVAGGTQELDHYHDQTAFQGGNSQIGLGVDQQGNLLAAGVVYYAFTPPSLTPFTNPNNYMAVCKVDPVTGAQSWTAAAWTREAGGVSDGKVVYQNGTTRIGRLRAFIGATAPTGPTMSAPMIDSVGNVWFVGSFERDSLPGSVSVGLFRAVLDSASFSYKLELVFAQGQTLAGRNSGRNYQITFLRLNDTNSISSGAAYSGNISAAAHLGQSPAALATSDARTLGGMVISAQIVYDNNGDGQFVPSTGTGGTVGSPDEDYQVLLYVGASSDCNNNGIPDDAEIAEGAAADIDGNGVIDTCEGVVGFAFCPGDGSGTACPCGNNSASGSGRGCLNSLGSGALLSASGSASLAGDTVVLSGSGMPNSSALYFQGTVQQAGGAGAAFGDGKRCAGGSVVRLGTKTNAAGASSYPGAGQPSVSVKGLVTTPGTRTYQVWYRNAAAFCTPSTFNLSNGFQITWAP
jgi:hypothetical protein